MRRAEKVNFFFFEQRFEGNEGVNHQLAGETVV